MTETGPAGTSVESLRRGLSLLAAFEPTDPSLSLADLSSRTGLPLSTALRLLRTLVEARYLDRDPLSRRFSLGVATIRLAHLGLAAFGPRDVAYPFLLDLRRRTGHKIAMGVRLEASVVLVEQLYGAEPVGVDFQVGSRMPAYCTSMGKVLLAELEPAEVKALFGSQELTARAPNTITDLRQLLTSLDAIRRIGYAIADQEMSSETRSVAAPVRDRSGAAVAAIAITCPATRVTETDLSTRIAAQCIRTATEISTALGFRSSRQLDLPTLDRADAGSD
jgi:IclR family pca regulon transcriptional regulator